MGEKIRKITGVCKRIWMLLLCVIVVSICFQPPFCFASIAIINRITTSCDNDISRVEIRLSQPCPYKIVSVDTQEIMIALREVEIGDEVFGSETVLGDPTICKLEISQLPSQIVTVIVHLFHNLKDVDYRIDGQYDILKLELKKKIVTNVEVSPQKMIETNLDQQDVKWVEEWGYEDEKGEENTSKLQAENLLREDEKYLREIELLIGQKKWDSAISLLENFISLYPNGPLTERAHFMLATSFHQNHENEIPQFLPEIVEGYQIAVSKFPESEYVPAAIVNIGNCYLSSGRHLEALNYYNRILEEFKENSICAEAIFQRGCIFALTKKPLMAIREFEGIEKKFPESVFAMKAKLELSKTLFDIKSFKRSLRVLNEIREVAPQMVYKELDILLYTGYNFYELGQLKEARETLLRVINYFPDIESPDLLLTRIADTYREDGLEEKASKLYDLVARTYPNSEGSIISLLRVAEGIESVGILDPSTDSKEEKKEKRANEIYQEIISKAPESPLAQVATLKLAVFLKKNKRYEEAIDILRRLIAKDPNNSLKEQVYQSLQESMLGQAIVLKETKEYEKSIEILKQLLVQFPKTEMIRDIKPILVESLGTVFKVKKEQNKIEQLIGYYEELKGNIPFETMPSLLLDIGYAYKAIHLYGDAYATILQAKAALNDKELPPEILLAFAQCAFNVKKMNDSEIALRSFIKTYPGNENIPLALYWLGKVKLYKQEHEEGLAIIETALEKNKEPNIEPEMLYVLAETAYGLHRFVYAEKMLEKAISLIEQKKGEKKSDLYSKYRRLGEMADRTGNREKAAMAYEKALNVASADDGTYSIQYKLAQCYQELDAQDKAKKILDGIINSGDPFWSKLAKTEIEEITIEQSAKRLGLKQRKS